MVTAPSAEGESIPERLRGTWIVDVEASVEHRSGVVEADSITAEKLRTLLEGKADRYRLVVSEDTLTLHDRTKQADLLCSTRYRGPSVAYLRCEVGSQHATVAVVEVGDGIRLLSSGTDDQDIYVWRRFGGAWTPWLDRDDPGGSGDYETLPDHVAAGHACPEPLAAECRAADGRSLQETGQVVTCDAGDGAVCVHDRQSPGQRCLDYEVRFLCPR